MYGKGSFLLDFVVLVTVTLLFGFEASLLVLAERIVLGHESLHHLLNRIGFWMKGGFTFEGMSKGAVGLHALLLELASFVLVEAGLSVSAIGEVGALNENGNNKEFGQGVYFV